MEITEYSRNHVLQTLHHWRVEREFGVPMFNYLVYGFSPGGCFTAVLANDFVGAMVRSHPLNSIEAFKDLAKWIINVVPAEARGSYDAVQHWCNLDNQVRRGILEEHDLVYTEQQEVWMVMKGIENQVPYGY